MAGAEHLPCNRYESVAALGRQCAFSRLSPFNQAGVAGLTGIGKVTQRVGGTLVYWNVERQPFLSCSSDPS